MASVFLHTVLAKLQRDRHMPWSVLFARSIRYGWELGTARLYLRAADAVGPHARTLGKPRIDNLGRIDIGAHVLLRSVNVSVELGTGPHGVLRIGDGARLNYGTSVFADRAVTIGNRVRIGPYVMIVDTDFHDPYARSIRRPGVPVIIEDDVWIGAKATILKGVRIGRGSLVGVSAVVTKSFNPFSIVGGVPAKLIGTLDQDRFQAEHVA